MNDQTLKFWNDYWATQEQASDKEAEAFQF